ncbi:long-chain-fatty-acid--CoA ligase [Paenibacillus sp. J31TS4]|uniref:AMP-binding protein n=1 Tax=Paenibacillus sp. J31TS4 TaxID=2807195 RepID=UPI001B1C168A|nr:AMP-binding protein [Paenibacillus sp. J31TS4]GIP38860.1 long-chain-fatty-acid--CoA ligase [Paenibacillus sp. J31TS4]
MTPKPWLLHYPKEVPPTYPYPKTNLADFLIQAAANYPTHTALHFMGKEMKYAELLEGAYRFAHAVRGLGVQQGDRVAIMLPNCPQLVIAYYGTLLAGGIVVMTNPLYMPRELEHQLADSGAAVILTLDLLVKRVREVVSRTAVRHIVVTSVKDYLPFPKNLLYPLKAKKDGTPLPEVAYEEGVHAFLKLMHAASGTPCRTDVDADRDLAMLQYTGGTTGLSKGVMLTHSNVIANTVQTRLWAYKSVPGKERYLAALPFFHVFGLTVLMNQAILLGGCLILVPKFEAGQILSIIQRLKPTIFPGAPTMYIALTNHPEIGKYDLSSINMCISGAAPLPHEVQVRFEEITGGRLIEGYGLTEASPVTHANNIWETRRSGSIGIPFPDTAAKIVHPETGEDLPPGEMGELAVFGPQVMQGYWNAPEETARVLRGGWLRTGDMARMDEDGFFYIMDRMKDIIIAGGFNIYPREIEEVLFSHPAIEEAVVVGVPDKYRGETVKVYVVRKEGHQLDAKELEVWCRERLAAYKVPHLYQFRETLPKTLAGKVLRRKLLEEESDIGDSEPEKVTK